MTQLCPKCRVKPARRQGATRRIAFCAPCFKATRRAHDLAVIARRKAERAAALAAAGGPRCPRCWVNPPRYTVDRPGAAPLCEACAAARVVMQPATARRPAPGRTPFHDIPAAEIDRRFEVALQRIRRRNPLEAA